MQDTGRLEARTRTRTPPSLELGGVGTPGTWYLVPRLAGATGWGQFPVPGVSYLVFDVVRVLGSG